MGLPHITSFCCCLTLEWGTKVIAYIHLVCSLIVMLLCGYLAEMFRGYIGTVEDAEDHVYSRWYPITCAITAISSVHAVLAVVLLIGSYKRYTVLLRAWVMVMLVLYLSAIVFILVVTIMHGISATGSDIFIAFIEGLVFFSVLGYSILCVNSFYMMLKSTEDMQGPTTC